jgi:hypothetical protein
MTGRVWRCLLAAAAAVALSAGCPARRSPPASGPPAAKPPEVAWSNITRYQTLDPGTVVDKHRYGTKAYWLEISRSDGQTWGKVRRSTYGRCKIGMPWPDCREEST